VRTSKTRWPGHFEKGLIRRNSENQININVRKGIPQRTRQTSVEIASVRVDIGLRTRVYTDVISTDEPL
jgi:hypothetical protein